MATFLLSGQHEAMAGDGHPTIQQISESLAGSGLQVVRLVDLETAAMLNALAVCDGNRTHAARALGISVRTLQRKLKRLNGQVPCE